MKKILVVDDVVLERVNVARIVKALGYEVIEAENGEDALKMAAAHNPSLVIMDIVMPKMDGFAALKRMTMNPELKSIPVVIVSSKGQESDIRRGQMLGSKGWLVKPVNSESVKAILSQLI